MTIIFNAYSIDNMEDKYYNLCILKIGEVMLSMPVPEKKEYVCTYCGKRMKSYGRPAPGMCLKKERDSRGKPKPHSWVLNN